MTNYDPGPTLASINPNEVSAADFNNKVFDPTNHTTYAHYGTTFGTLDIINGNLDYTLFANGNKITPEKIKFGAYTRGKQVAQNLNIDIFKDIMVWNKYVMIPGASITVDAPYDYVSYALITYNIMLSNAGSYDSLDFDREKTQQPNIVLLCNDQVMKYCGRLRPGVNRETTLQPRWNATTGRHYLCGHAYIPIAKGMNNIGLALQGNADQVRIHARAIRIVLFKPE